LRRARSRFIGGSYDSSFTIKARSTKAEPEKSDLVATERGPIGKSAIPGLLSFGFNPGFGGLRGKAQDLVGQRIEVDRDFFDFIDLLGQGLGFVDSFWGRGVLCHGFLKKTGNALSPLFPEGENKNCQN
jgi:hypothetical protein